ncbi:methionyl-tRNA formyltransferase [Terrimonas alba]|uniref:methionyl-tRNA formyltransferase n=1 Tax=Terrimonas alba TaxID=3349636 RepID=UPI0035F21E09
MQQLFFFNQLKAVAIPAHCEEMIEQTQEVLKNTGIPILILTKERFAGQLEDAIGQNRINLGLVMTFSYKIPASVYSLAGRGFYNVHPGLLPGYGGVDPIFQQIKNQEKFAGVTIHQLDEGIDTGPIVMKERVPLAITDTHGMLTTKLSHLAVAQIDILIKMMNMDVNIHSKKQDEGKVRYFEKQTEADITIDWEDMDASSIIALINACNPWNKGAVTKINNQVIRLLEAEKLTANPSLYKEPGYIIAFEENGMIVSTLHGEAIIVKMIYAVEGFLMASRLNQLGILPGNRFEIA